MQKFWVFLFFLLMVILVGCAPSPTAAPTPPPEEQPLYLAIIWHQHQPLYYKDPETGVYSRPWVRVHAAKDYYDMAAILKEYPDIHVTFNLTSTLIRQLDDLAAGAEDLYWTMTEIPSAELIEDEKRFILTRFFDANWDRVIPRFSRYLELLNKRGRDTSEETIVQALETFTVQDFRDLQVLFNLAWTDPDFLAEEPLQSLVEKGRNFREEDKQVVLAKHLEIIRQVVPLHRQLQEAGQIEITMTPYAHPILPLLYDTNLAKIAIPNIELPTQRFSFPNDAIAQVELGVEFYGEHFGQAARGMWPAEGSVAQEIVKMVSDAGIRWMASDEEVLAKSLGMDGFTRNSRETLQEAEILYQPYYVAFRDQRPVAIVFRDHLISDKVGFVYSGLPGEVAAQDFINRLHAIKEQLEARGSEGPNLVTVLLDGENAWEWYENDGKEFLYAMYQKLSDDPTIKTVTPSEYLALFPDQPKIDNLWAGSWVDHTFSTWIGEPEENRAWEYLLRVREFLAKYDVTKQRTAPPEVLEQALLAMYAAEGSDWFWWYGSDQSSGQDEAFDLIFRSTLMDVYRILGVEIPAFLYVPVIPKAPAAATNEFQGPSSPTIDGVAAAEEWASAAHYEEDGEVISGLWYTLDANNLYLRLEGDEDWSEIGPDLYLAFYMEVPRVGIANSFSRFGAGEKPFTILGFPATHEVGVSLVDGEVESSLSTARGDETWQASAMLDTVAFSGSTLEVAVPFELLGEFEAGDSLNLVAVVSEGEKDLALAPEAGLVKLTMPDLGLFTVLSDVLDPAGDDDGPGTYLYPTDAVFAPQIFDLSQFIVGYDEKNLIFKFTLFGPIANVWNSPIGLSTQAFDVYIDVDQEPGSGARMLLPGRNAAVPEEGAWDYAIWVEGWTQGVYVPGDSGQPQKLDVTLRMVVDPASRTVTIKVPREAIPGDPAQFGYLGIVLSQEGFPAPGVWRIRDVLPQAAQWRFGGGPDDTNHTRIIDLAWLEGQSPTQEDILSDYLPSQETAMETIPEDDFAQIPMLRID